MTKVKAFGAQDKDADLKEITIERRDVQPKDVKIKITYCGVCHSDIHTVRNDWKNSQYPVVPGHEIIGKVIEIGTEVTNFKEGDLVGVGCMVDSCRTCESCKEDLEQFCENGMVGTYNGKDSHMGGHTFGGYSQEIVVDEHFVLTIPDNLDEKAVAPLLCAGITTYSPLRNWNVKKGDKVGVVGLGGLGHMAVKLASSMGAEVTMLSRSPEKEKDATDLGAAHFALTTKEETLKRLAGSFDLIIDTVSAQHDYNQYLALLKTNGVMVLLGVPPRPSEVQAGQLIMKRRSLVGSLVGGIKETQEMLDYCAEHGIVSEVEMINIDQINEAYERTLNSDVRYRFVIDMKSLKEE